MNVHGGRNVYGHAIGILVLDTAFPRIPGDIGNALTFPFPVLYHRVREASPVRVVREGDPALLEAFIHGARALESAGVLAITTSCGFLAMFQAQLCQAVRIPVFTSALQLVPLVSRMLAPGRAVGILTVDARALGPRHLTGAGIGEEMTLVIQGLEGGQAFTPVVVDNALDLDVEAARREIVGAAREMVERHPHIGAIVLECANMPPYAAAVREATGLPVFDITTLVRMMHRALVPQVY
jgi:hypothetical protein